MGRNNTTTTPSITEFVDWGSPSITGSRIGSNNACRTPSMTNVHKFNTQKPVNAVKIIFAFNYLPIKTSEILRKSFRWEYRRMSFFKKRFYFSNLPSGKERSLKWLIRRCFLALALFRELVYIFGWIFL